MIFIKRRPLATRSTAWIKPSAPLFLDLISTADQGADGYDGFVLDSSAPVKSGAGGDRGQRQWGAPSSPYATSFSKLKAPTRSRRWEASVLRNYHAEMDHGQQATEWRLGWCLVTVRAASGEASAPRTCAEAYSSSPLASRPINCSERQWKNSNLVAT
jgi:hypothetical protein